MATLSNAELGSVIYNLIPNITVGVSGTLSFLVNQAVYTAENYTGNNLDVNAITEPYQPAVISLTLSNILSLMESQGIGTKSVSIGELSITKGMQEGTSKSYKDLGYSQLNDLGFHISTYQCV